MPKCIYSITTGELICWWENSLIAAYTEARNAGADISIFIVTESIEFEIRSGKAEYRVINGKLAKDEN